MLLRHHLIPPPQGKPDAATVAAERPADNRSFAPAFSVICYFTGRDLHARLDVPVGLVASSVGGTPIECWTRAEVVATCPDAVANNQTLDGAGNLFEAWGFFTRAPSRSPLRLAQGG